MDNQATEPSTALDTSQAADAFSSLFSGESNEENAATAAEVAANETPEQAAERLLLEDANQDADAEGKQDKPAYDPNETVTVEIDGKMVELTKAQVAEAKKGELRQQDYTRKTMETAEERKAATAAKQAANAERDNYAQQLQNFAISSESILAEQAKVLTDELLRSDPVEYLAQERTFRQRQAELGKAQQELTRINGERQQEQEQQASEYQREQLEKLQAKLPAYKDPVKAREASEKLKTYLMDSPDLAFSMQEIASLGDHRLVVLADKAAKFDALMTRAKETAGKVAKAPPKVERPGMAQVAATDGRTKAMQKLKSSGSISDAAAAFGLLG